MWSNPARRQTDRSPRSRRKTGTIIILPPVILAVAAGLHFRGGDRAAGVEVRPEIPADTARLACGDSAVINGLVVRKGQTTPYTGFVFENYPGGSRKLEMSVRGGKLNGFSKGWHSNGRPEVEETFVEGLSEGRRIRWHSNGVKKSEALIHRGKLSGAYTEWHDNGQKAVSMTLAEGQAEGTAEAWHPSGALKSRTVLEHGKVITRQFFEDPAAAQAKAH